MRNPGLLTPKNTFFPFHPARVPAEWTLAIEVRNGLHHRLYHKNKHFISLSTQGVRDKIA